MDKGKIMTQTRWKKRLLWAAVWAAGIVLVAVLAGAFLFRHELKTLATLEKIDDNVLYTMKYDGDYGFDDFLLTGASTDGELVRFVTDRLLRGLPAGVFHSGSGLFHVQRLDGGWGPYIRQEF